MQPFTQKLALLAILQRRVLGQIDEHAQVVVGGVIERFGVELAIRLSRAAEGAVAQRLFHLRVGPVEFIPLRFQRAQLGCPGPDCALIVTQINVDGAGTGPDVDLYVELLESLETEVIASGGVGNAEHLRTLAAFTEEGLPLAGAIVGKALYEGALTIDDALAAARSE